MPRLEKDLSVKKNFIVRSYIGVSSHGLSKDVASMLYLFIVNKDYDDAIKEIINIFKISEEDIHAELKKLFKVRNISMSEKEYINKMKTELCVPRPCIVSFLEYMGFDKNSEGFDCLAMAVLDGNSYRVDEEIEDINSVAIKDGAECFCISEEEFASKVKKCLETNSKTAMFSAGDGAAYLRNILKEPTDAIRKKLDAHNIKKHNYYNYFSTLVKLMILGPAGYVYSNETSMLFGKECYSVTRSCSSAIANINNESLEGGEIDIYNFVKSICEYN